MPNEATIINLELKGYMYDRIKALTEAYLAQRVADSAVPYFNDFEKALALLLDLEIPRKEDNLQQRRNTHMAG